MVAFFTYYINQFKENTPEGNLFKSSDNISSFSSAPTQKQASSGVLYHGGYRYEGKIRRGLPHGQGKLFYQKTGKLRYEGAWSDGDPHGQGTSYFENGSIRFQGHWNKGLTVNFRTNTK